MKSDRRDIVSNALVAVLFGIGPLAIMVSIARSGGLSESDLVSWAFGGYGITGLMSIAFALRYRQPLPMAWTIAGAVLVGPALERYSFAEIIGAYCAVGAVVTVLGMTGWIRRVMDVVPMPIVFGMVAGVFLKFALDIVGTFDHSFWLATIMVGTYVTTAAIPSAARVVPPLLAALATGIAFALATGGFAPGQSIPLKLATPNFYVPQFSLRALVDLVIPLTVTVIGIHNAQGFVLARSKGIDAPVNFLTTMCGVSSFAGEFRTGALVAFVVTVSGIQPFGIGAAFWGLVFGYLISRCLERDAYSGR